MVSRISSDPKVNKGLTVNENILNKLTSEIPCIYFFFKRISICHQFSRDIKTYKDNKEEIELVKQVQEIVQIKKKFSRRRNRPVNKNFQSSAPTGIPNPAS